MYDRATAEARRLLETHVPVPLEDGVTARLREIVVATEKELGVT